MDVVTMFRNLVIMAAADGRFTTEEIALLAQQADKAGLSADQLMTIIEETAEPDTPIELPTDPEARRQLAEQLLRMMAADGHLAPNEKHLFATLASQMELTPTEIDQMIARMNDDV